MFITSKGAKRLSLATGLVLLVSCSTSAASSGERTGGASRSSRALAAEELDNDAFGLDALQAVERLRPTWLRIRGQLSTSGVPSPGVRLYVDGSPRGYADDLAGILVSEISEMRFLDSREATIRYGTGYPDGAIVITTRQR